MRAQRCVIMGMQMDTQHRHVPQICFLPKGIAKYFVVKPKERKTSLYSSWCGYMNRNICMSQFFFPRGICRGATNVIKAIVSSWF